MDAMAGEFFSQYGIELKEIASMPVDVAGSAVYSAAGSAVVASAAVAASAAVVAVVAVASVSAAVLSAAGERTAPWTTDAVVMQNTIPITASFFHIM